MAHNDDRLYKLIRYITDADTELNNIAALLTAFIVSIVMALPLVYAGFKLVLPMLIAAIVVVAYYINKMFRLVASINTAKAELAEIRRNRHGN